MHANTLICLLAAALAVAAVFWWLNARKPKLAASSVSLQDTISEIRRELARVAAVPGQTAGLELDSVKIELTLQRQSEAGGSATLAVPVFDAASVSTELTRKLTRGSKLTLVLRAAPGLHLLSDETGDSRFDLSALVLAARSALVAALAGAEDFTAKSVEIEVTFVLVESAGGGAKAKAWVVELGGKSSLAETAGNKVVLSYARPGTGSEKPVPPG